MPTEPINAGLETVLDQRRQRLEEAQLELASREREAARLASAVDNAQAQVHAAYSSLRLVLEGRSSEGLQVDEVQQVDRYVQAVLRSLECQRSALTQAEEAVGQARSGLAYAHVQVRMVEVLLERRALELATKVRRQERRFEDEVAATSARRASMAPAAGQPLGV